MLFRSPAITGLNSHWEYHQRSSFGAVFFCFGANTPTPEFCENSRERGPRSPAGTAQGFDPPLGAQRNAAARAAAVPEPSGRGKKAAMCFGGADAGGLLPGRRGTGAVSGGTAGAFGAGSRGVPSGRRAANGARAGLGRVGPQRPRVGRDGAGRARAGRRGAGGIRRLSGADAGRARPGAAVYGGRAGYSRGRRAYCRGEIGRASCRERV